MPAHASLIPDQVFSQANAGIHDSRNEEEMTVQPQCKVYSVAVVLNSAANTLKKKKQLRSGLTFTHKCDSRKQMSDPLHNLPPDIVRHETLNVLLFTARPK